MSRLFCAEGAPVMRSSPMRARRCSRSNRLTASTRPATFLPWALTARYAKRGIRSAHPIGEVDHAHHLVEAGRAGAHQAHAVVGEGLEAQHARRGENLARG